MKNMYFAGIACLLLLACQGQNSPEESGHPVNLILDTDFGPDYDDVGAMALLYCLADSGKVNVLATVSSNHHDRVVPCIDVINNYFGYPDMPVGAPKSEGGVNLTTWHKIKWTEYLPEKYPHRWKHTADAPDAVEVYRRILQEAPDSSITICTIGFFPNLRDLLISGPDSVSPLTGKELAARKVKKMVSMAGRFPEGEEFNVQMDTPASVMAINQWPGEIVFCGFEIGENILTGKSLLQEGEKESPVWEAYNLCMAEGDSAGRMSWDQAAVWVAVKGSDPYFATEKGRCIINEDGSNRWESDPAGKHLRLIEKTDPEQIARVIESYMTYRPGK